MRISLSFADALEPALNRFFGNVGTFASRRPYQIIFAVLCILAAMSFGMLTIETENDVNDLLIARRGRIAREKDFFVDNFELISPVLSSVIITAKEGVDIFSVEALDEVHALQESIRTFTFEYRSGLNVSLEQICFRTVNAIPTEPCWQSSLLESFREGDVFNVGGELNTDMAVLFAAKTSYRDFNFTTDFKRSFLAQTNLNPDSLLLGQFVVDEEDQDTITSVAALQIAFGAKSPKVLQTDGLQYFEWNEKETGNDVDGGAFCPDPSQCEACAAGLQPAEFVPAECTSDGASTQSTDCCGAVQSIRANPCIDAVFEGRVEVRSIANSLFAACDLPTIEISPRCSNRALILGSRTPSEPPAPSPVTGAQQPAASPATSTSYEATITTIHEETDTIDKARRLTHEWEKAWRGQMGDAVKQYQYIDVVYITSTAVDDEVAAAAEADMPLLVLGYGLVFVYLVAFCSFDWSSSGVRFIRHPPGPFISTLCFILVLFSVVASIGVTGYISATSSFKVTFSTVQQVPLLMVGLGVNDFFVLVSAMKTVTTRPSCPKTVAAIMYETMAIGGTSVTLSSAANAVAFAISSLSPVPSVLWYGVQMSVSIVIAYIVSITAIPSLLSIAVRRHVAGHQDPFLALFGIKRIAEQPTALPNEQSTQPQGSNDGVVARTIRQFRWPITLSVFSVFTVWMVFGIRSMVHFDQGVALSESVEEGAFSHNYLRASEKYFDTNQINIVFRDSVNYTDPADFQSVRRSEFEYVNEGHRVEKQLLSTSWMEFYTQYVENKFCVEEICMSEVDWYYDGFSSTEFAHPAKNICAGVESATECEEMCETHCPQGPEGSRFRCQYTKDTTNCYCPYRPMLKMPFFYENPDRFDGKVVSYWADFLGNTPPGLASRLFFNLDTDAATQKNPFGIPKASRAYVFARGLQTAQHQVDHIKEGRRILDRQDVDAYGFDFLVYAVGEQYDGLVLTAIKNVGISLAVATVIMMPLLVDFYTACIVTVCVLFSVLLTAGTTSWTRINLDFTTYIAFIAAIGLSVEFCAHIARAFMLASGDRLTRTFQALRTMGVAIMNGGITTFLGIFPAMFSYLQFIYYRLFVQFSIIVAAGLFIGLIFLPTVLSLIGSAPYIPPPEAHPSEEKDEKSENVADVP